MVETVTVIVPVYNERESLPELLEKIDSVLSAVGAGGECIISDDGSTDGSADFLEQAKKTYPWLRAVSSPTNRGKSSALARAIAMARGEIILMMDGDLQNDPDDFIPMLDTMQMMKVDCVVGWRSSRQDSGAKNFISSLYNHLLNLLFGMRLHDHNCGIKLLRKNILLPMNLRGDWHRYITVLLFHAGYKIAEIPVKHYQRPYGHSRYGINRYIHFLCDMPWLIYQAWRLRRRVHHENRNGASLC